MISRALRSRAPLAVIGLAATALVAATPAEAYSSSLTRAPYLSDLTSSGVYVNFGTTTAIVKTRLRYGPAASGCSLTSATSATTAKQQYSVTYSTASGTGATTGNQWKVKLSGLAAGKYCYRADGTTSSTSTTYTDLFGTSASPTFSVAQSARFAVIGDWGRNGSTSPDYLNSFQADVIALMAKSGAGFAMSTGDIGYDNGSQSNYGDLIHRGPSTSEVFGPKYWPVAGSSMPMLPVPGNHGFTTTFTTLWPSTSLAAGSSGRATNGQYSVNGSTLTVPEYWYAFNDRGWRIYTLTAAWGSTYTTGGSAYAEDYKQHWAPGAAERTWLSKDLAAHPSTPKIVVFHFPLYSAVSSGDVQDRYLTAPPDGTQSLESQLSSNNVKLVVNGHSHIYERNNVHNGLTSVITGGGGGDPSPVTATGTACTQTYPGSTTRVVAKAIGWGSTGGSACNTTKPTSIAKVYHYLLVTLSSGSASVTAIDSTGATIDSFSVS
jgi:hypothetical protein